MVVADAVLADERERLQVRIYARDIIVIQTTRSHSCAMHVQHTRCSEMQHGGDCVVCANFIALRQFRLALQSAQSAMIMMISAVFLIAAPCFID